MGLRETGLREKFPPAELHGASDASERLWEAGEGPPQESPPHCLGLASVQADEVSAFGWSVFLPGYLVSNPVSSFLVLWQLLPFQKQRVRNLGLPGSQKSCPLPDPALPGALPW